MLVSITTLGAAPDDVDAAVGKVLGYLHGPAQHAATGQEVPSPGAPGAGPARYYAEGSEFPGRWRAGAPAAGAPVGAGELEALLRGQDLVTGAVLVEATARASDAEVHRRLRALGEQVPLPEAAAVLGVSSSYMTRLARETARHPERRGQRLVADKVDGRWSVSRTELARFVAEREVPKQVIGYDVTFSAPKSVSILWALGTPEQRAAIDAAIDASVQTGVAYLEANAVQVRRGRSQEPASGMRAVGYRHDTNRNLEPQLHEHVVIANVAAGPDGRHQALDARGLYAHATTAGHLAGAQLRHQLTETLGLVWDLPDRGLADIDGVDRAVIDAFSTRRAEILSATAGNDSTRARQRAALTTRKTKPTTSIDANQLTNHWHQLAHESGLDTNQLAHHTPTGQPTPANQDPEAVFAHLSSHRGVTEQRAVFDRRHVIQTIVDHHPNTWTADQIEHLADAWLATAAVIPLGTEATGETIGHRTGRVELAGQLPRYTTPEILTAEHRVLTAFEQPATHRTVHPELVTAAIDGWQTTTGHQLGRDQAHMVRVTTGPDRFGLVLGAAGAGKTTALEVAATAWTNDGRHVLGAAVNGTAAEVLGDTTGIPTTTLASLLTRLDTTTQPLLNPDTVVIVDEASTIGTRDLARLVGHVDRAGASLRLVGDPHQHGAVEAGGLFAHLVRTHEHRTPTLTANRRQAGAHMSDVRDAVAAYRDGDRSAALRTLDDAGRIDTGDQVLEQLVADWYQDHQSGAGASRMIAEHHHTRRALNEAAQALLRADGTLTGRGGADR